MKNIVILIQAVVPAIPPLLKTAQREVIRNMARGRRYQQQYSAGGLALPPLNKALPTVLDHKRFPCRETCLTTPWRRSLTDMMSLARPRWCAMAHAHIDRHFGGAP
jgi:hypothetical protein